MTTLARYLAPFLAAGLILLFTACQKEGPMEKAGKKADQTVEKAEKKVEEAADAVKKKTE
jgi:hypothetical protein